MLWFPVYQLSIPVPTPYIKVPLFIASTYVTHIAITPPNPPPKTTEAAHYGKQSDWISLSSTAARSLGYMNSVLRWAAAIGESTVILASGSTTHLSNNILSLLTGDDPVSATKIHLTPLRLAGIALMLAGSLIRISCHRALGRFFTWELSVKKNQTLITTGPYSIVRHPSYTGIALIYTGAIICDFSGGSWYVACGLLDTVPGKVFALAVSAWWIYLPIKLMSRAPKEDAVLRETFGEEWVQYAKKTPYRLVPYIY